MNNMNLIQNYFGKVQGLSDDLDKQLLIVLGSVMGKAGGHSERCFFFKLYHNMVSVRVQELAAEDLTANKIVSLLTLVLNEYLIQVSLYCPLCYSCSFSDIWALVQSYLSILMLLTVV